MGTKVAAFLSALYQMVDDPSTNHLITWIQGPSGADCFAVSDPTRLSRELFPRYFKHSNWASASRQLHMYQFQKVGNPNEFVYYHPEFRRGRPELLCTIKRRHVDSKPEKEKNEAPASPPRDEMMQQLMQRIETLQDAQDRANERLEQVVAENKRLVEILVMHEESQAAMEQAIQVLVMKYVETFARQKGAAQAEPSHFGNGFTGGNSRKRKYLASDVPREPGTPFWTTPNAKMLDAPPPKPIILPSLASCLSAYTDNFVPRVPAVVHPFESPIPAMPSPSVGMTVCTEAEFEQLMDMDARDVPSSPPHVVPSSPSDVSVADPTPMVADAGADAADDIVAIDAWLKEILDPHAAQTPTALPSPLANMFPANDQPVPGVPLDCGREADAARFAAMIPDAEPARARARARLRAAREAENDDEDSTEPAGGQQGEDEKMVTYVRSVLLRMHRVREERVQLLRTLARERSDGQADTGSEAARAATAAEEAAEEARVQGALFDQALSHLVSVY